MDGSSREIIIVIMSFLKPNGLYWRLKYVKTCIPVLLIVYDSDDTANAIIIIIII